jgi:MFS family permease
MALSGHPTRTDQCPLSEVKRTSSRLVYVGSVWLISYATTELDYDRTTILSANAALSLSDIPMILAFGLLSDYIGRRKMFLTGITGLAFRR